MSHPNDYERSDVDPRLIGALALGLVVFIAMTPVLLAAIYPGVERHVSVARSLPVPPPPRLEIEPRSDLASLHGAEDARLDGYGWADRARQSARIPIARAMQLIAERGLPGWPASDAPQQPDHPAPR